MMAAGIIGLLGLIFMWVGISNRGNNMWKAIMGSVFKPLGQ